MEKFSSIFENSVGIKGIWNIHSFDATKFSHLTDDEIENTFVGHYKNFRDGKVTSKFPAGLRPEQTIKKNLVVNGLIDTIIHRMIGTYTGTEDLQARKLAIGLSNLSPASGNAQLGLEIYRSNFTDSFQDSNTAHYVLFVNRTTANGNESLTVADAGNTTTQFKVSPGTSTLFNIGDRVRVTTTSQFNFVNITNINTSTDTITVGTALADIPVGGEQIIQVWAEAGIFGNSNTGATANTGTLFNRVNQLEFVKDDTKIILIEVQFIFNAV